MKRKTQIFLTLSFYLVNQNERRKSINFQNRMFLYGSPPDCSGFIHNTNINIANSNKIVCIITHLRKTKK